MKTAYLLGNDPRYTVLSRLLTEEGFTVFNELPPTAEEKPALYLFPFGTKEETLLPPLSTAPSGSLVAIGRSSAGLQALCRDRRLTLFPLLETEEYLAANARETAQGVLTEILNRTDRLLDELTVLVTGFGRCGRELCHLLWLCGAEVWVHSNKGSKKRAAEEGWNICPFPDPCLAMFDLVINTATSPLFDKETLSLLREDTVLYQVASGSAGFTEEGAKDPRILPLPAMPGKHVPQSEGELLFRLLLQKMKESEGFL